MKNYISTFSIVFLLLCTLGCVNNDTEIITALEIENINLTFDNNKLEAEVTNQKFFIDEYSESIIETHVAMYNMAFSDTAYENDMFEESIHWSENAIMLFEKSNDRLLILSQKSLDDNYSEKQQIQYQIDLNNVGIKCSKQNREMNEKYTQYLEEDSHEIYTVYYEEYLDLLDDNRILTNEFNHIQTIYYYKYDILLEDYKEATQ